MPKATPHTVLYPSLHTCTIVSQPVNPQIIDAPQAMGRRWPNVIKLRVKRLRIRKLENEDNAVLCY